MSKTICIFTLQFFLYSTFGWLWESTVCSLYNEGHLINRGFFNGPYCPIYGWGALCGMLLLQKIKSPILLFFSAGFSCCSLEYVTSFVMEKLFHARWWDYSDKPFNLHGRVYLPGFLAFGGATVALVKWIDPFVFSALELAPYRDLRNAAYCLTVFFAVDNLVTFSGFIHFEEKLKEINLAIELEKKSQQWRSARQSVKSVINSYIERLTIQELRILSAYPRLRSLRYDHVLMELRAALGKRSINTSDTQSSHKAALFFFPPQ